MLVGRSSSCLLFAFFLAHVIVTVVHVPVVAAFVFVFCVRRRRWCVQVMPQTLECVDLTLEAEVPTVVAITKCDMLSETELETARERIVQQLLEHQMVCEDFGGDTQVVCVSAKTGEGMDDLLESIQLQAEVLELKADPGVAGEAVVLESYMQQGLGPVVDALVLWGSLSQNDWVVAGHQIGKVRRMFGGASAAEVLKSASPAMPVRVCGFKELPPAGVDLLAVESESVAESVVEGRKWQLERQAMRVRVRRVCVCVCVLTCVCGVTCVS